MQGNGEARSRGLYLDLMKRCLSDSLHVDDPLSAMILLEDVARRGAKRRGLAKRLLVRAAKALLEPRQIFLVEPPRGGVRRDAIAEERALGRDWPGRAHTMIGLKRLDNVQECVETVLAEAIPGDLIETGVWRGGATIFMRAILEAHGETGRTVWVADSFAGLPPPDADAYPADAGDQHHVVRLLAVSRDQVAANFAKYGLLDSQVRFLEGWFKDTLTQAPIERLAVLRLDGDMYESTIQVLEALYDKLSPGGFAIVDDYVLPPCRTAVQDFRAGHGITEPIVDIDGTGAFWRKHRP